ncbi:MAG: hypothetical protein AAGC70_14740 [Pseudomonadota bacterium]
MRPIMGLMLVILVFSALATPVLARKNGIAGYVVARSDFGNGTVRGPVRHTRLGRQVRLPGGTWVYCRQSCSETLRVETVDFWQSRKGGNESTSDVSIFGRPLRFEFGW